MAPNNCSCHIRKNWGGQKNVKMKKKTQNQYVHPIYLTDETFKMVATPMEMFHYI